MRFEFLLGLPLEIARESLDSSLQIVVIESAPPFHPRGYTPHWGEARVIRARDLEPTRVELCVARDLVGEERAGKGSPAR